MKKMEQFWHVKLGSRSKFVIVRALTNELFFVFLGTGISRSRYLWTGGEVLEKGHQ